MESTHVVIDSVHDGTIEADDAMRILIPHYAPELDHVTTVEAVEEYMHDTMVETGRFPEEFIDFNLCEGSDDHEGCHRLTVWDDVSEDFRHLTPSDCWWTSYDRESLAAAQA